MVQRFAGGLEILKNFKFSKFLPNSVSKNAMDKDSWKSGFSRSVSVDANLILTRGVVIVLT